MRRSAIVSAAAAATASSAGKGSGGTASRSSDLLKNLPPEVVRELKRHVKPSSAAATAGPASSQLSGQQSQEYQHLQNVRSQQQQKYAGSGSSSSSSSTSGGRKVLIGCLTLAGAAGSFPLVAHWWLGGTLVGKEDGLTAPQNRRGAFQNSGSKDVGRDPNWDFETGQYKNLNKSGYGADDDDEATLPGIYYTTQSDKLKQEEKKLEAYAKGQIRPTQ